VAAVDLEGDGDIDLLVMNGAGPQCFRNRGDGTFEDVTRDYGLKPFARGSGRGLICIDLDGDGRRDLFCAVFNGPNVYYRGAAGGRFSEATARAGLADSGGYSTGVSAADQDGDGDLDLYICNYGDTRGQAVDDMALNGEANRCFRNDGNGSFTDQTDASGLGDTGYSLAASWADVDGDGDQDCYVANDFAFNRFFINDGTGAFDDATRAWGAHDVGMGMNVTWADLDGDGDLDVYVSNMFSSTGQWIFDDPDYPLPGLAGILFRSKVLEVFQKLAAGNTILRNDGDRFTLRADGTGAANGGWSWAAPATDLDADGRTDLYVVNGMVTGVLEEDT
jgi:hypothetical protein